MHGIALAVLIYFGVSAVWDLIEPDAVRISFGNPMRGVFAVVAQVAIITLCLMVLHATVAAVVSIAAALFCLACFSKAVND